MNILGNLHYAIQFFLKGRILFYFQNTNEFYVTSSVYVAQKRVMTM